MKKNVRASNLMRTFIVSVENLNPNLYEKLGKVLKKIPKLKLLYHDIKFSGNYNNIMLYDKCKLLLLIQKCNHANNVKKINQRKENDYLFKDKRIFNQKKVSSYLNYDHYTYKQYKSYIEYYEKRLKPNLNKSNEKEKILLITLKGLVLTKFF